MSPDLVARAAVRAVRFDLAVVPVRTEAWLGYFMLRIAPAVNRRMTQPFSVEALQRLGTRLLSTQRATNQDKLVPRRADSAASVVSTGK